jgi:glycosyltransferase involved in cell wall biosynthesis
LRGAVALGLPQPLGVRTVFDAVDCLEELARLTSRHNPNPVVRAVARYEQRRTARLEARLLAAADVVTVAAERDRRALLQSNALARIVTIPNGVTLPPHPAALTAEPHVIFTGKLAYHANAAAARRLLEDVWPRVLAQAPEARLTLAGADPPGWLRRAARRPGVELIANPDDLGALLQTARVAAAPIVYSVGIQNKVLEAMAAGVPVVGTSSAAAGLTPTGRAAMRIADTPDLFADRIVELLLQPRTALELGRQGRRYVMEHHTWQGAARRFEALYCAARLRAEAA